MPGLPITPFVTNGTQKLMRTLTYLIHYDAPINDNDHATWRNSFVVNYQVM